MSLIQYVISDIKKLIKIKRLRGTDNIKINFSSFKVILIKNSSKKWSIPLIH